MLKSTPVLSVGWPVLVAPLVELAPALVEVDPLVSVSSKVVEAGRLEGAHAARAAQIVVVMRMGGILRGSALQVNLACRPHP